MRQLAVVLATLLVASVVWPAAAPSHRQVIPAAASAAGVGDSYWRTDLTLHNPSDRTATITLEMIPSGFLGAMGEPESAVLPETLAPGRTVVVTDVLDEHFPDHRTGALVVVAEDADGLPVAIIATSRTWTPPPTGAGSFGQGIPAETWSSDGDLNEIERVLPGLEATEEFRSNLGLVNLSDRVRAIFRVEILDSEGESAATKYYGLEPLAHVQRNEVLRELGLEGAGFTAVVRLVDWQDPEPGAAASTAEPPDFVCYVSKVDNSTNDPSYQPSLPEVTRWGPPRHRIVAAAASTPGSGGSWWTTDLVVHMPGDGGLAFLLVHLIPTGGTGIGTATPERVLTSIRGGQTLRVVDIIGDSFPDHEVAALVVEALAGSSGIADIRVGSRTATAAAGGGSFGQGIPGVPRIDTAQPAIIAGLEESDDFRSNFGLVNASLNLRQTFEVTFLDATGVERGTLDYTLEPWSHLQVNRVLDELGLEGSSYSAVVTLATAENLYHHPSESWDPIFFAYGSTVDRHSNDPTYLAAVPIPEEPPPDGHGDWYDFSADAPWYRCPEAAPPEEATVVTAFDRAYHYFGAENARTITQEVDFPEGGEWNQVGLELVLECPESGLCDHWDRSGSLQLVLNPTDPEEEWQYLELMRHITPYRVEMCQYVDITPLASLLRGRQTLESWIDTWVGPGHASGEGWRISFRFVFYPGASRAADEVINVWGRRNLTIGSVDPDTNIESQIDPVTVTIPADADRVTARLTTTGHSFGNTDNCAEFCVLRKDLWVGDARHSVVPWRTDCEHNPVTGQQGTMSFDRNGWCPGAIVVGDTVDITNSVVPGEDVVIDFDVRTQAGEEYENVDPVDLAPYEWYSLQLYVYRD